MIRILHVIGVMNRGGAESMIMNLYREIDKTKVQFDFVEHSNERAVFDDEIEKFGGRIYRCPKFVGKNYFAYKKWWDEFFENEGKDYQIIHGHIGSTAAIYLKCAKKKEKYTIAHSHSSGTDHSLHSLMYSILSYNTRNIADYFFGCSLAAGIDRYGHRVTENIEKFKVLPNAIDIKAYIYSLEVRKNVRKELGYSSNELVIGHVGRMTAEKNHAFILEIFRDICKVKSDVRLLLIGEGKLREELQQKTVDLGLEEKVCFTGIRSDVNRLMQAMDIFVFPSIYEGLGIALIEAQASGLPCIISDKIPNDGIVVKELVTKRSLEDSSEEWARHILSRVNVPRMDTSNEIREHGFDIKETSKWLERFYIEKTEK
ncbi:glycosyltransferase family 1 protein [Faecalimonas sp.]